MENTHTILIQGGLGNQLFQIFTLINYCKDNNYNFIFPYNMQSWDKRSNYWDTFFINLKKYTCSNIIIDSFPNYEEIIFNYKMIPLFNNNIKLNGYFQSDLYFKKNYESICDLIGVREKQIQLKKYINTDNNISLHFRMGDFGNVHHPILPDSYYINSLNYIINKTNLNNWNIYYCCEKEDDNKVLLRIKNINQYFKNLNFIKINNNLLDWEQMLLMSICQHNIIANSTYSWWSAYFNQYESSIVCYPSLWFGPAKKNIILNDLFPREWNKINII